MQTLPPTDGFQTMSQMADTIRGVLEITPDRVKVVAPPHVVEPLIAQLTLTARLHKRNEMRAMARWILKRVTRPAVASPLPSLREEMALAADEAQTAAVSSPPHPATAPVITIDGPSGAGKSSSAVALAGRLGLRCLNSGSLYRAVAWRVLSAKLDPERQSEVEAFCHTLRIRIADNGVWVDDVDVTPYLRRPDVTQVSSSISAFPGVRQALIAVQRDLAKEGGLVAEGRDMGTVVFPHADVKFYLDADPNVRSLRQYAALSVQTPVQAMDPDAHGEQVRRRDLRDRQREVAPLKPADDAIRIDSTRMTLEAVIARMLSEVERVLSAR